MNMLLVLTISYFLLFNHTWSQIKSEGLLWVWLMGSSTKTWRMLQPLSEEKEFTQYDFLPSFQIPSHSIWNIELRDEINCCDTFLKSSLKKKKESFLKENYFAIIHGVLHNSHNSFWSCKSRHPAVYQISKIKCYNCYNSSVNTSVNTRKMRYRLW